MTRGLSKLGAILIDDAQKYRDQAARIRRDADAMQDPIEQRMARKLAELYESLASHTEKRQADTKKS